MRREDRERSSGEQGSQRGSDRENKTEPSRPKSSDERVTGRSSDESGKMPSSHREPGRLPLPD